MNYLLALRDGLQAHIHPIQALQALPGWAGAVKPFYASRAISGATPPIEINPNGIAIAMGIQWRLINQPSAAMDSSCHWVSTKVMTKPTLYEVNCVQQSRPVFVMPDLIGHPVVTVKLPA